MSNVVRPLTPAGNLKLDFQPHVEIIEGHFMANGHEFEENVGREIDRRFPHSRLARVLLFRPDLPEHRRYGFEIDHLLHARDELVDRLFIIECKAQPVIVANGEWRVPHPELHDIKRQLWNQAVSLMRHIGGTRGSRAVRIEACVVADQAPATPPEPARDPRVTYHLFDQSRFFPWMETQREFVQRVEQSSILGELRNGVALPELGRPDIANAIRFVEACRRTLDHELFRRFPSIEGMNWNSHAAVNGTAGMGKSVMLAYILFVLSCDFFVDADDADGRRKLVPFREKASDFGIPVHSARSITAFAMSQKQVRVLEMFWRDFVRLFGSLGDGHLLHFQQPAFRVWDAKIPDECNVLVVDEAHDLKIEAQQIIASWKNEEPDHRYLVVACDRHQRLRLSGNNATIIHGLSFSQHTVRLRRNYRSPFPVYAASLALMFRWCATAGPKVIPSHSELEGAFGFRVERPGAETFSLTSINDSHPGNHWCYTLSRFVSAQDAFREVEFLRREDVLWVRFGPEEILFDYERVSAGFTYHPMDVLGPAALIDKYIKGQEFPVVVVEGLPGTAFESREWPDTAEPGEPELAMWQARRELFLCASRANVFLYFVVRPGTPGEEEVESLLSQIRRPADPDRRLWRLKFTTGRPSRRPGAIDRFEEDIVPATTAPPAPAVVTLRISHPTTFKALVAALESARGIDLRTAMDQVLTAARHLSLDRIRMDTVLDAAQLRELERHLGVVLDFPQEGGPVAPMPANGAAEAPAPVTAPPADNRLAPGMTVEEVASRFAVSVRTVLDLLPLTYTAQQAITEDHIPRLAPLHLPGGEPLPPATPMPLEQAPNASALLKQQILDRMAQPDFVRATTMVKKYVILLTELAERRPDIHPKMLRYRPRSRTYFARSAREILANHSYAQVYPLGTSGIHAMCTLSNESKLTVLRDIFEAGMSGPDISDICRRF